MGRLDGRVSRDEIEGNGVGLTRREIVAAIAAYVVGLLRELLLSALKVAFPASKFLGACMVGIGRVLERIGVERMGRGEGVLG